MVEDEDASHILSVFCRVGANGPWKKSRHVHEKRVRDANFTTFFLIELLIELRFAGEYLHFVCPSYSILVYRDGCLRRDQFTAGG
jgi:hypothetical protein